MMPLPYQHQMAHDLALPQRFATATTLICAMLLTLHFATMQLLLLCMSLLISSTNEPCSLVLHGILTLSFIVIIIIHYAFDTDTIACHIFHLTLFLLYAHVLPFLVRFSVSLLHLLSIT